MPNDCTNHILIYADTATINLIKDTTVHLKQIVQTKDETPIHSFRLNDYGTGAIAFTMVTAWTPPHTLLEDLMHEYPIELIKNDFYIEDGMAGLWIGCGGGNAPKTQCITWLEGCLEEKMDRFKKPSNAPPVG